jgi:hypothetical protein
MMLRTKDRFCDGHAFLDVLPGLGQHIREIGFRLGRRLEAPVEDAIGELWRLWDAGLSHKFPGILARDLGQYHPEETTLRRSDVFFL